MSDLAVIVEMYVALTLHLDGRLWTEDGILRDGLRARGFNRFFES